MENQFDISDVESGIEGTHVVEAECGEHTVKVDFCPETNMETTQSAMETYGLQPFKVELLHYNVHLHDEFERTKHYTGKKILIALPVSRNEEGYYVIHSGDPKYLMVILEDTIKENRDKIMEEKSWFRDGESYYKNEDAKLAKHINHYIDAYLHVLELYEDKGPYNFSLIEIDGHDVEDEGLGHICTLSLIHI